MICNETGGVIDDTIFYRLAEDRYLLIPNAGNRMAVVRLVPAVGRLQVLRTAVGWTTSTEATALIALQGPQAPAVLDRLCTLDSGDPPSSLRPFTWGEGSIGREFRFRRKNRLHRRGRF